MRNKHTNGITSRTSPRNLCAAGAILALSAVLLPLNVGCEDAVAAEFRSAALGSVESGVNAIMDGVLEGIFAVAEPSPGETSTGGSSTTGTSGTTGATGTTGSTGTSDTGSSDTGTAASS